MKTTIALFVAAIIASMPNPTQQTEPVEQVEITSTFIDQPIREQVLTPVEFEPEPIPEPAPPTQCPDGTTPLEVIDGIHKSCLPDKCWHMTVSVDTPECLYGVNP
jgi:hypothetical protein